MNARRLLALTAASGALVCSAPLIAQPQEPYEYAEDAGPDVIYHGEPVIQPLPAPPPVVPAPAPASAVRAHDPATVVTPPPHAYAPPPHAYAPPPHAYAPPLPAYASPHHAMGYGEPPFDRGAWLANCRERIRGVGRRERSEVIGGLLGAAAGGVIGNRAWNSERLAGTLLGAGVGGLAGLAIGSAVGAAGERRREDECAWHLDRYMAAAYGHAYGYGYPAYGYGYGYGYPAVAYVPVLVAVPQRAVVRETVTEEWIESPAPRAATATRVVREPTPAPDKRIKLIKPHSGR